MAYLRILLPVFILVLSLGVCSSSFAGTDLSLDASDITFSKEEPLDRDTIRLFARVFNVGEEDAYGFVVFSINGNEIADPQPISVKSGTYDDVFIDWVFESGNHNIRAEIVSTWPKDETLENNSASIENYFVDLDSDNDGIGDSRDNDNDNDGLSEEEEFIFGTDPFNADTDGDEVNDSEDAFPLDPAESQDFDKDGLGDNADEDDDNDGLSDEDELLIYNTDPLNADTDGDLIPDKIEVNFPRKLIKPDRNEWRFAAQGLASVVSAIKTAAEKGNLTVGQLFAAFGFLVIVFLIVNHCRKRND
jgi:hypothetical protein